MSECANYTVVCPKRRAQRPMSPMKIDLCLTFQIGQVMQAGRAVVPRMRCLQPQSPLHQDQQISKT